MKKIKRCVMWTPAPEAPNGSQPYANILVLFVLFLFLYAEPFFDAFNLFRCQICSLVFYLRNTNLCKNEARKHLSHTPQEGTLLKKEPGQD